MVDGLSKLDYEDRLRRLDLPTLVYRRARGDMIQVYKHFHAYDQDLLPSIFQRQMYGTRHHEYQLVWRKPKDGSRGPQSNSFYYRIMQTWNELPANVVKANSLMAYVIPVTNLGQKEISMYSYSKFPEDSVKIMPQA